MSWDDDKSTAADPDNPAPNEQLTADEWDAHVTEGHFPANELNFGVDSGDPVMTDPQNGDEIIARYDRSEGAWIVDKLGTEINPISAAVNDIFNVSTGDGLVSAVSNASNGDWIKLNSGTYTIDQWPDLDGVSGVIIEGDGPRSTTIKPADGANIGGIRVGTNSATSGVIIRDIGYDGNDTNQTSGKRHHGVTIGANASHVAVRNCFFTRTHPYHQHDDGGSGVSVRSGATDIYVQNNRINDIGDRGIQCGCESATISGNIIDEGYDRAISLDVYQPDDQWHFTTHADVHGNVIGNSVDGSLVGVKGASLRASEGDAVATGENIKHVSITGNSLHEGKKSVLVIGLDADNAKAVKISGNSIWQGFSDGITISSSGSGDVGAAVSGNLIVGKEVKGISASISGISITGNSIIACGDVGIKSDQNTTVTGNEVLDCTSHGIEVTSSQSTVSGNRVEGNGGTGILSSSGTTAIVGNYAGTNGDHGIELAAFSMACVGNYLEKNNQNASTSKDILIAGPGEHLVGMNSVFVGSNGGGIAEDASTDTNHLVGNYIINSSTAWTIQAAGTTLEGNRPTPKVDVRNFTGAPDGTSMYHDGSGANTEGEAQKIAGTWTSLVDGTTIS